MASIIPGQKPSDTIPGQSGTGFFLSGTEIATNYHVVGSSENVVCLWKGQELPSKVVRKDPTNDLAEQAIRFIVIDRKVTQGTRSLSGRKWSERIWTAIATCTQQGRSVFDYINEAIFASFQGRPAPSLLPNTS